MEKKYITKGHAHKPSKGKGHYDRKGSTDILIKDLEEAVAELGLDYNVVLFSRGK